MSVEDVDKDDDDDDDDEAPEPDVGETARASGQLGEKIRDETDLTRGGHHWTGPVKAPSIA